jgi:hypothetical protein
VSKSALLKILKSAQVRGLFTRFPILSPESNEVVAKAMDYLENVANGIKEMTQNISLNADSVFRSTAMVSIVVESGIIRYAVDELVQSRLCGLMGREKEKDKLHSSQKSNCISTAQ